MSERKRQVLLSWSLLVCVVLAFVAGVYLPCAEYRDGLRERHQALVDQLARLDRIIRTEPLLRGELAAQERTRLETSSKLVDASSAPLGSASLQRTVAERISSHGVGQTSIQPLQPSRDDVLARLSLNAQLNGSYESLHGLLYELETGLPRIFIDELVIEQRPRQRRRPSRRGRQPVPAATDDVTARIRLSAYMDTER